MDSNIQKFIQELDTKQKKMWESFVIESNFKLDEIENFSNVSGQLDSWCRKPGTRPQWFGWREFSLTTVINDNDDWTIFGTIKFMDNGGKASFSIDLLKSQNLFEVRIGDFYPWRASLSDSNAVSYRTSGNKIIIRAVNVINTNSSYCVLTGMIAAETNTLRSVEMDEASC